MAIRQHHAIHLETTVLLNVFQFISDFEAALARIPSKPLFIVSPPHSAGYGASRTCARVLR